MTSPFNRRGDVSWANSDGSLLLPSGGLLTLGEGNTSPPVYAAAIGDSITAQASQATASVALYSSYGYVTWANILLHQRIQTPLVHLIGASAPLTQYNRAVSGDTTISALPQLDQVLALAPRPKYCYLLLGTNDLTAYPSDSAATIFGRIKGYCDGLLAVGITPILMTLLPRGNGSASGWGALSGNATDVASARKKLFEINRQIRAYPQENRNVIVVDPWSRLVNWSSATSDPQVALIHDYVHPSPPGAFEIGKAIADAVGPRLQAVSDLNLGAADVYADDADGNWGSFVNSAWGASGGTVGTGVTGSAPANFTINRLSGASGTAVSTLRARTDGGRGNEVALDINATDACSFRMYQGTGAFFAAQTHYKTNDGLYGECDVDFSITSGSGWADLYTRMVSISQPEVYAAFNDGTYPLTTGFTGRLRTPILVNPSTGSYGIQGWTIDRGSAGSVITSVRRKYRVGKFDQSLPGAVTWVLP